MTEAYPGSYASTGVFSRHHRKVRTLFAVSDVVLTLLAFHAAYVSRLWIHLERNFYLSGSTYALLIGFSALAWVTLAIWLGIYEKLDSGNPRVILRDALRQCVLSLTALVLFQYVVRLDTQLSRSFIGLFGIYSWTFLCLFRLLAGNAVGGFRGELNAPLYVMIAGVGESAKRLAMELERSARYGVRLSGFLTGDPAASPQRIRLQSEYEVHPLANLPQLLRERVIDEVLFTLDGGSLSGLDDILVRCDEEGVRTRVLLDFFPHVNSEMYLDRLGSMPLLTFAAAPHDDIRLSVKRFFDLAIAGT
ncbi:MAG: sugar transferase, partial [Bryobacteraceae bacterium]